MAITTGVGLVSGLNYQTLIDGLMNLQKAPVTRLTERQQGIQATQTALKTLSANLLTLTTTATQLGSAKNFNTYKTNNSDTAQLSVALRDGASVGTHDFQSVRLASLQQLATNGFVNADTQTIGTGEIVIAKGGSASVDTALSTLNGGTGIRRGTIRITDRSGASADIDLSKAATVTDVLDAINRATGISVRASTSGDHLEIADTSGSATSNLTITDLAGGHAAADLGIAKSVASDSLAGSSVYKATGAFTLSSLNDGNGLELTANVPDLRIALSDPAATTLDVDLDGALTLNDVVNRINSHADNGGKLAASIVDGHLLLTDTTGGGGSQPLSVSNLNGSNASSVLGLDVTAAGNTVTGRQLVGGLNSVLLRNLNGGQGITQLGQVTLTDRSGKTATIDLSNATSLDQVIAAINGARDGSNAKLQLSASLNAAGNRVVVQDTSGSTAGNLVIADVAGGTVAADLGITVNAAQNSVRGSTLDLRFVNEATSLAKFSPSGSSVRTGSFTIADSSGSQHVIAITSQHKTVGDVLQAINAGSDGKVTAQLNETGDGFVLIDQAGGAAQLTVTENGGSTAADLRIVGTGVAGGDGKSRISSRQAAIVKVAAEDTLNTLRDKLTAAKAGLSATVVDDGSAFAPKRLLLTSNVSGAAGRLVIDDGALDLGLQTRNRGDNALLRVGSDGVDSYVLSSATNHFDSVAPFVDVDLNTVGTTPAHIDVVRDTSKVSDLIKKFVDGYNSFVDKLKDLTKFDADAGTRGALQGDGLALRVKSAMSDLIAGTNFGATDGTVHSLADLGIELNDQGKLTADSFALQITVAQKGDAINAFFLDAKNGFGAKLKSTLDSFTDATTGKITGQTNSLQTSVDTIQVRIDTLNSILDLRRERLIQQFSVLESTLSLMQSQKSALGQMQNLYASSSSS